MSERTPLRRKLVRYTLGRIAGGVFFALWRSLFAAPVFSYTRARAYARRHARKAAFGLVWLAFLVSLGVGLSHPAQTAAATSNSINFQARLEANTGAVVADGWYNVEFKLYSASSGGSAEWTEDRTYSNGSSSCTGAPNGTGDCRLQVINGYLTANLGSITGFPGTINWDQQQWLTMNIGGTVGSGTITWDGEMSPRLALTAIPYAFRAGQLADPANSGSTLTWAVQGSANSLLLPNEAGTLCVETSINCGFATSSGSGSYIQNQTASPQTAGFYINGAGTLGGLLTGTAGATLSGAAISLNASSNFATNINTGSSTGAVNIGNSAAGAIALQSATTIGLTSGTTLNLTSTGANNINLIPGGGSNTGVLVKPTTDSTSAFQVQKAGSAADILNVDTSNGTVTVQPGGSGSASIGSNLITTTDFTNAAWTSTGWTTTSTTATNNSGNTSVLSTNQFTPTAGASYLVTYTIGGTPPNASSLTVKLGSSTVANYTFDGTSASNFSDSRLITFASGTPALSFSPSSTFTGVISAVSVKLVTLNTSTALAVNNPDGSAGNLQVVTSSGIGNIFIGQSAGISTTSGVADFGIGLGALKDNTTGVYNTGLGISALQNNTIGNYNTAFGGQALGGNTIGSSNTAFGYNALQTNTTGSNNLAFGYQALQLNTLASNNIAIGYQSLFKNTTGANNTALGYQAGYTSSGGNANTTGSNNTFIGYNSGPGSSTQLQNATSIGTYSVVNQNDSLVLGCISGTNGCTTTTSIGIGTTTPSGILQVSGGTINLNASSNNATNINTGSSTGAVSIGNGAAGAIGLTSGSTITSTAGATAQTIANLGEALKVTANSASAFQVQNTRASLTNLVLNPSLENNSTGNWVGNGAGTPFIFGTTTTWAASGTYAGEYQVNGDSQGYVNTATGTSGMPVTAGTTYTAQSVLDVLNSLSLGVQIQIKWYNSSGTLLSSSISSNNTGTGVQNLSVTAAAPATAAYAAVYMGSINGGSTGTVHFYWDAVALTASSNPIVYFDGTYNGAAWTGTANASTSTSTSQPLLNVSSTGAASFQNSSNSANAFQIQNAVGANYIQVDTSGANIYLANATANINASSNFATNINTGSSTGSVSIGNGSAGVITLQSGNAINLTAGAASTWTVGSNTLGITSSNFTVSTGGVLNVIGGSAGYQIGGAATTGNYLRGNGTSFVSSAIQAGDLPSLSGTYLRNVPAATSDNTVAPTLGSVVALTVNGTSGTTANAVNINQSGAADGVDVNLTNGSGAQTNGVLINRSTSGGTTTNGLQIQETSGTLTNGLLFSGTIGTDVSTSAGRALFLQPGILTTATGTGGQLTLQGGNESGTTTAVGGNVAITAGSATGGSGSRTGGNVTIDAGTGATSNGGISLGTTTGKSITLGNTTDNTTLTLQGTGLTTLGGGLTFSGTSLRTITGPTTGGLTITVATGPLTLQTTSSGTLAVTSAGALNLTGAAASTWTVGSNTLGITSSNFTVSTGGVLNVIGGSAGYQIGGAATTGNYLRGNGTSFVSSAIQPGDIPVCTGTCNYISNQTGLQTTANFDIQSAAAGSVGGVIEGAGSQTADLLEFKNSTPTVLSEFTSAGALQGGNGSGTNATGTSLVINGGQGTGTGNGGNINFQIAKPAGSSGSSLNSLNTVASLSGVNGAANFQNSADSTTAFQIQNAAGTTSLFSVDTSGLNVKIGSTTTLMGTGLDLNDDPTTNIVGNPSFETGLTGWSAYWSGVMTQVGGGLFGADAMQVTTVGGNGKTDGTNFFLPAGLATGTYTVSAYLKSSTSTAAIRLSLEGSQTNSPGQTTCTLSGSWQRCIFTTNVTSWGPGSNNTKIDIIENTDNATAQTWLVDGVQMEAGSSATTYTDVSRAAGSVLFDGTDSTTAFQVQNGSNASLLTADTTNTKLSVTGNLVVAGGINISGLSVPGAPVVTQQGTGGSGHYTYAVSAVNASGNSTLISTTTQTLTGNATLSGTNYNVIAWAGVPGASSYNIYRTAVSGGSPSTTGLISNVLATSTLSFNDTGIAGGSASPTIDNSGQLQVSGTALFQNAADSAAAFQIQNAADTTTLFSADTATSQIGIIPADFAVSNTFATSSTLEVGGQITSDGVSSSTGGGAFFARGFPASGSGLAQYVGNWESSGTWGIGPFSSASDNTLELGNVIGSSTTTSGVWNSTQNLNLLVGGAIGIGTNAVPTHALEVNGTGLFEGTTSSTAFQVQNASNVDLLQVDTSSNIITLNGNDSGALNAWATNTNALPQSLEGATSVTANGYVYEIGGYNGSSKQSTVYYAQLNSDGSTGAWNTNTNALPTAIDCATSVVSNGYVYVLGGDNGPVCDQNASSGAYSTIYYAQLNPNGSTGAWNTSATSLPQNLGCATSAVANGYVYVMGGSNQGCNNNSSAAQSTVYYAPINANGSIGSFTTNANPLPATRVCATSVIANGYVYVMGGNSADWCVAGGTLTSTVYYAQLNSNGSTGTWSTDTNALPTTVGGATSAVANGYVYVMGGKASTVYYAQLNSNGSTGAWTTNTNALPGSRSCATSIVSNGYVYEMGGGSSTTCYGSATSTVYYSSAQRVKLAGSLDLVGSNGSNSNLSTPGDQSTGSVGGSLTAGNGTFVGSLQVQGAASFAQSVSIAGDLIASGTVSLGADVASAAPSGGGTVGTWTATTSLPAALWNASSVASNGYIYEIGGNVGATVQSAVYYAPLGANGTVGAWNSTTSLPTTVNDSSVVVNNGYIYVLGGTNNGTSPVSTVYYAAITANGTVGPWNTTTSLTTALSHGTAVVNNGYIYFLGGNNGTSPVSTVYYAAIQAGGTLAGSWTTNTNALPATIYGAASVVNNGYVYELGGNTTGTNTCTGTNTNAVYHAQFNANGSTGTWTTDTIMSNGRYGSDAVAWGGYVYNLSGNGAGGGCGTASVTNMDAQPATSTGNITSWGSPSGPYQAWSASSAIYNGYAYQLGGTTTASTGLTTVQYASVSGNQGTTAYNGALQVMSSGNVCIDLNSCSEALGVNGTGVASGGFSTGTPDVAEYIDASPGVTAQDVVIADPNNAEAVTTTSTPYDPAVIGVIANGTSGFQMLNAHYGQAFDANTNTPDPNAQPMTVAGRVPVLVTGEGGSIKPGDYLTTSSTPGYAMKADHAGPTIGKALGYFNGSSTSDQGSVLVLVTPGYYGGPSPADYIQNGGSASLADLTVTGTADFADLNVSGSAILNDLAVSGSATIASLTVTGNAQFNGDITIAGHVITAGGQPTGQIQTAAGQIAANDLNGQAAAATIAGNDTSGTITITTSDNPSAGDLLNVTFSKAYTGTPRILISGQDGKSAASFIYPANKTDTGFELHMDNPPQADTTYTFDYFIAQ